MSFLTAGEPEVRAWTIKKGTNRMNKGENAINNMEEDNYLGFVFLPSMRKAMDKLPLKKSKEFVLPEIEGQNYTVDIKPEITKKPSTIVRLC